MTRLADMIRQWEAEDPKGMSDAREWARNLTLDDIVVLDIEHIEMRRLDPERVATLRERVKELIAKYKAGR